MVSPEQERQITRDLSALYWGHLDQQAPWLTEFALGGNSSDFPLTKVSADHPSLDLNPFFMRTQTWEASAPEAEHCAASTAFVCVAKQEKGDLLLAVRSIKKTLRLREQMSLVLETDDYLLLTADNNGLFKSKLPNVADPGEGLFFIAKADLPLFARSGSGVPIFFLPMPDSGWTGALEAFEWRDTRQIAVRDQNGFTLPIQIDDLRTVERVSRNNLRLAMTWSFLEGRIEANGMALPLPNTTLAFGTFLSGKLPFESGSRRDSRYSTSALQVASSLLQTLLPAAEAKDEPAENSSPLEKLRQFVRKRAAGQPLTDYAVPAVLWGARFGLAFMAYDHVDWSEMIPADLPPRLASVGQIMGGVAVASVALRFSVYKSLFAKKYPTSPDQTWLQRLNNEHKAFLDVFTHSSYFAATLAPQAIRQALDYLKDHFFPSNKMLSKAWDDTMGFQLRQHSRVPMNWKSWWYGVPLHGGLDCLAIFTDLMILMPFAYQHWGWGSSVSMAGTFVVYEVFRNFQEYFKLGAHLYAADVKHIHILSAEHTARAKMEREGLDPENPRHQARFEDLVEEELARIYKTSGLPGQNEFLFDTNTVTQDLARLNGFGPHGDSLSAEDKAKLEQMEFLLSQRHWGLVTPALRKALSTARADQKLHDTDLAKKTVRLLESSLELSHRSATVAAVKAAGQPGPLFSSMQKAVEQYKAQTSKAEPLGALRAGLTGAFRYLVLDSTREVRDQRLLLWLMSSQAGPETVSNYMPQSWIQRAGGPQAAYLAGLYFHRAFLSQVTKEADLSGQSASHSLRLRAEKILAESAKRQGQNEPTDSFERKAQLDEILERLQTEERSRQAVVKYEPPQDSPMARRQWALARQAAASIWSDKVSDERVLAAWSGMAKLFAERSETPIDEASWISAYRYRLLVAREFGKQVDLHVELPENSEFVRGVVEAAALNTELQLAQEREATYMARLSEADRQFFAARLFTAHFTDAYVERSVHSNDHLYPPSSTEYPGRFQAARRRIVGLPGAKVLSFVLRSSEAFYRNEASSYRAGGRAWFYRKVPVLPDMWINLMTDARNLPYQLTFSYATSYLIWQIQWPYLLYLVSSVMGFVHPTLFAINNRFWRNHGMDPMRNPGTQASYTFTHGVLTNVEPAVIGATGGSLQKLAEGATGAVLGFTSHCAQALLGLGRKPSSGDSE